ncbi:Efflux pump mlcE [Paramyrothecium foliicola]|nr:Efflux pump mlcE [Paramyrothecium foliicola]
MARSTEKKTNVEMVSGNRDSESEKGPQPVQEDTEYLSGIKLWLVMFSVTLAAFLMLLDASVVATAIPKITSEFQSLDDIGCCAFQPLSGKIYTHFNVKWTYLSFFAVFELGSLLCGAAVSSSMLCIGRAVAGLGAAGLLNGGLTMLPLTVAEQQRPKYQGVLMGIACLGLLCGPLVGGALTEHATWRWCFYINLPCGAVIALFLFLVPLPTHNVGGNASLSFGQKISNLDLIGFILFAPAVVMFILALQWGGKAYAWSSATILGLFCGALVNLLVFLAWERHVGVEAMIPLSLLRRRIVWCSCLTMICFIGCNYTTSYYFPIYFQAVRGASAMQSGVGLLPQIITNMIVTIMTGILVGRVGYYLPFALVSGIITSVGTGLITTLTPTSPTGPRVAYQILQGFQGMGFQIPLLAVQHAARKEDASIAYALVIFSQNLSAAIFLSIAEVVFGNRLRHFLSVYAPDADMPALIASGASATGVKAAVSDELLPAVRIAYNESFVQSHTSSPKDGALDHRQKPTTHRRVRVPLSCESCRARKLKCNREQPCQNCITRGQENDCNFSGVKAAPSSRRGTANVSAPAMRGRIDKLEQLVKKLIAERQNEQNLVQTSVSYQVHTPDSTQPEAESQTDPRNEANAGRVVIDGVHSVFSGGDDWYAVLQEIDELKESYSQDQEIHSQKNLRAALSHTVDGSSLLFRQANPIERLEILASLPPKAEVNQLISRFFDRETFPITFHPILHEPTFRRELEEHWKDPSRTNFIWLGLLFSILAITMLAHHHNGERLQYEGIAETRFELYRVPAELNRRDDNRRGLWILTGVVVRAAINMGYHRDPSQSPEFSALQAEYRRRVWLSVIDMDDMTSFLGGFPRTTAAIFSDTAEPRNLHDWELPEDPQSRLLRALGLITDFNSRPNVGSYDTVLEIDRAVSDAYEGFPPHLKVPTLWKDDDGPIPSALKFSSLGLLGIYYKGLCILHPHQRDLDQVVYLISLVRQLLTLGAMIICFELELRQKAPDAEADMFPSSQALIDVLEEACNSWAGAAQTTDDAARVYKVIASMLSSYKAGTQPFETATPEPPGTEAQSFRVELSSPFITHNEKLAPADDNYQMDFDWTSWDAFIEEAGSDMSTIF